MVGDFCKQMEENLLRLDMSYERKAFRSHNLEPEPLEELHLPLLVWKRLKELACKGIWNVRFRQAKQGKGRRH